jgi:hypothetical protein
MNLIANSIRLASAGGQVIVSTALSDRGEIAFASATPATACPSARSPPRWSRSAPAAGRCRGQFGAEPVLTKALVEANRAQFNIKSAGHSGTLIEVVFSPVVAGRKAPPSLRAVRGRS